MCSCASNTAILYRSELQVRTNHHDFCRKQEKYTEAREVLKDISTKNVDWPEAIWEAWLTFEHLHGSMTDLEACLDKIERAQQQVNTRRAKVIHVGEA